MSQQSSDPSPLVQVEGLHLKLASRAGLVNVLNGIDFSIEQGETVGVVGPSGSGKSSLLMILGGLERPTAGQVRFQGQVLNDLSEDHLARLRRDHMGIVFQSFHLIPTMTALENVAIPLELAGAARAFGQARESLESVGLGHRLEHYPGQLSGGEQQRVALARAFVAKPKLLLADEPTGNLDGITGQAVADLLFRLNQETGASLVLVTHDQDLATRCGRCLHLADGRIKVS